MDKQQMERVISTLLQLIETKNKQANDCTEWQHQAQRFADQIVEYENERDTLQSQVHALLAQVDELKTQRDEARATFEGLEASIEYLDKQLAESREAARIVDALESKKPYHLNRNERGEYYIYITNFVSDRCATIADALRAAGLMQDEGAEG